MPENKNGKKPQENQSSVGKKMLNVIMSVKPKKNVWLECGLRSYFTVFFCGVSRV